MSGGGGDKMVLGLHSTAHILFLDEIPSALLTYLSEPSCTSTETRIRPSNLRRYASLKHASFHTRLPLLYYLLIKICTSGIPRPILI